MSDELFFIAARDKYRFSSVNGELTAEQLFDLPLTSRNGLDLDTVARTINASLKEAGEESFVNTTSRSTPARRLLTNKLELVKAVIEYKEEMATKKQNDRARAEQRDELRQILQEREKADLRSLSREELEKRLAELSA